MRNIIEYLNKSKDDKKNFLKEGKNMLLAQIFFYILFKNPFKKSILLMKTKNLPIKHLDFFTASLGDLITLSLLSWIASLLFADIEEDRWLSTTIIATYVLFTPVCIYFAKKHASTIGKQTVDFT